MANIFLSHIIIENNKYSFIIRDADTFEGMQFFSSRKNELDKMRNKVRKILVTEEKKYYQNNQYDKSIIIRK